MIHHRLISGAALAGLLVLLGCSHRFEMAEVEGVIKLRGAPLDKIQVEFWPEVHGPRSMGVTDAQGRFTLTTDDGKRIGAAVGHHRIVLRDIGVLGDEFLGRAGENVDMTKGKKPRLPDSYADPHKTPFRKEVTGGKCFIYVEVSSP